MPPEGNCVLDIQYKFVSANLIDLETGLTGILEFANLADVKCCYQ